MPTPRFLELGIPYEISLFCRQCGYAVIKDYFTEGWTDCPLCSKRGLHSSKLETIRVDYPSGGKCTIRSMGDS